MSIPPCADKDVNPESASPVSTGAIPVRAEQIPRTKAPPRSRSDRLPVNNAPYTTALFVDHRTGRRIRSRVGAELALLPFELSTPIRTFPAFRGRRSHQGKYWFSHTASHVGFESRFERTALTILDFRGDITAVSSNPVWLLWPRGSQPQRHAPDFFARRRDGSALVMDVKPQNRLTDSDRIQHARTRSLCSELGWDYEEFTIIDPGVEHNLRLLSGYRHPRFDPEPPVRAVVLTQLGRARRLEDLIGAVCQGTGLAHGAVVCGVYHMLWRRELRVDLSYPMTWDTTVHP